MCFQIGRYGFPFRPVSENISGGAFSVSGNPPPAFGKGTDDLKAWTGSLPAVTLLASVSVVVFSCFNERLEAH